MYKLLLFPNELLLFPNSNSQAFAENKLRGTFIGRAMSEAGRGSACADVVLEAGCACIHGRRVIAAANTMSKVCVALVSRAHPVSSGWRDACDNGGLPHP